MGEYQADSGSLGSDSGTSASGARSGPPLRVTETDLAILVAFCRAYTAGHRFPSPAPNNKILEELAANGLHMDLDSLRTHLRNLYARFGVEDGLTPAEKRVRLVELVYENGVIPGWGEQDAPRPPASPDESSSPPAPPAPPRRPGFVHDRRWAPAALAAAAIGLTAFAILVGLGGRGNDRPASGDAGREGGRSTANVIDPRSMSNARGTVTYCTSADVVSGKDGGMHQHRQAVTDFNDRFGPDLHVDLSQFPQEATQQYEQFSRIQRRHSGECDVFYSDVTWTAEFAHKGWLLDLSPYVRPRLDTFVPAMRQAAVFDGRIWGVPKQADAGLLFYNTDRVKTPPATWQRLYRDAAPHKRLRYQALDYEGLTVNFLELAYAAGAEDIVTPDHKAHIDQNAALVALQLMVEGIRTGAAPREVTNQTEEASIHAFGRGKADFMRNWPYAYVSLPAKYPKIAGHFGVAPLPSWNDRAPISVLGGHILVISAFTEHPGAALKLVDYLSSRQVIKQDATEFSLAPSLLDLWEDPEVERALPAFDVLKSAIFTARSRPVTPEYQAISAAISKNVYRALRGSLDPETALATADDEMQQVLDDAYRRAP
jgi:multiple sugar transport system substrate-binding protein